MLCATGGLLAMFGDTNIDFITGTAATPSTSVTAESCNGRDDNGNGQIDEGLGTFSSGLGVCRTTVPACMNGA
ncbi:MAG: hypothetical protein ACJ8KU_09815 [Chthoniobacterales bacterium]|jgi:hypothetical protein